MVVSTPYVRPSSGVLTRFKGLVHCGVNRGDGFKVTIVDRAQI